jgi:hypothetical protein
LKVLNRKQPSSLQGYDPVSRTGTRGYLSWIGTAGGRKDAWRRGGGDWNERGVPSSTGGDGEDLQLARDAQPFRKSTSVPVLCFDNDQIAIIFNNKLEIAFDNMLFAGSMSW